MQLAAVGVHHRRAELVQQLEGRLIPLQTELLLELSATDARSQGRDQPRPVEPGQDRSPGVLQDGPRRHSERMMVRTRHRPMILEPVVFRLRADRTGKALGEPEIKQVLKTRLLTVKVVGELGQRLWSREGHGLYAYPVHEPKEGGLLE